MNAFARIWFGLSWMTLGVSALAQQHTVAHQWNEQVLEAIRIMEEGVIGSVGDGNIGSIMGIGFPPHTGGVYQCVNAYGVAAFAERARELAAMYGETFVPPKLLEDMAAEGRVFA